MQRDGNSIPSVYLNLPADSLEVIAGRPKVPEDLYIPIEDWQTRILTKLPGKHDAELRCELDVVDLVHSEGVILHGTKQRLLYQALSYSWGYLPSTETLICNGKECQISSSLKKALRTLRHLEERVCIWVDAFCVNQADPSEKSRQIQNMRLIFAKAVTVGIWLGDAAKAEQIRRLLDQQTTSWEIRSAAEYANAISTSSNLQDLLALCRWFRRGWVRQEVAAARKLVFIPETTGLKFESLCARAMEYTLHFRLKQQLGHHRPSLYGNILCRIDSTDPFAPLFHMARSRLRSSGPYNRDPLDTYLLLKSCLTFQATDPKDKVYGVLGLLLHLFPQSTDTLYKSEPVLHIDYTKSVAEVFMDMTMHLLLTTRHLDVLELHMPKTTNAYCLPSWVFNFDSPSSQMLERDYKPDFTPTSRGNVHCYRAPEGKLKLIPRSRILVVHGHIVGEIETVGDIEQPSRWRSATVAVHSDGPLPEWAQEATLSTSVPYKTNALVEAGDTVVCLSGGRFLFALRSIGSADVGTQHAPRAAQHARPFYCFLGPLVSMPSSIAADVHSHAAILDLQDFHLV